MSQGRNGGTTDDHPGHPRSPAGVTGGVFCSACALDFTRAIFGGGDFSGCRFRGSVSFADADFVGDLISFDEAGFLDGAAIFRGARFGAGAVTFNDARCNGGTVSLGHAMFSGCTVSFVRAQVNGAGSLSPAHS
ncbi:pentapeptide repeat-containing protein [Streptomyces wedmorensis]